MSKQIVNHFALEEKSRTHSVSGDGSEYTVTSGNSGSQYTVSALWDKQGFTCTCPWGEYKSSNDQRAMCSHVMAVLHHEAAAENLAVSIYSGEEAATVFAADESAQYYGDNTVVVIRPKQSFIDHVNSMLDEAVQVEQADDGSWDDDLLFAPVDVQRSVISWQ